MKNGAICPVGDGFAGVAWTNLGVTDLVFPRPRVAEAAVTLWDRVGDWREATVPTVWGAALAAFFGGELLELSLPVDLGAVTAFGRRVLEATTAIPVGVVRTYGQLAVDLGLPGGARAVGQALRRNPVPGIIPCHRVVGISEMGGYREGSPWKEWLLEREGVWDGVAIIVGAGVAGEGVDRRLLAQSESSNELSADEGCGRKLSVANSVFAGRRVDKWRE